MRLRTKRRGVLMALLFCLNLDCSAERSGSKPQWVSKGETSLNNQRSNHSYYFKVIQSTGNDLQTLINNRIVNLANYIGQSNNLSGTATTEIVNAQQGGTVQSSSSFRVTFKNLAVPEQPVKHKATMTPMGMYSRHTHHR